MADEGASNEETQLTFSVKSSSDAKYVITVSANLTVADLKNKLSTAEYADLPASRQRLIYSGRVLKDQDTLASYKIKDGNTVHLVKGAESNNRQNPANQGGSTPTATVNDNPASNVPSNIAAGQGAHNPLAQLTGARYAGFHGLPGMDTFGADGGMGAPPDPEQLLRLLEDPNFAQQMNEAMNNPAVLDMMRQNPMMRNNPMLQHVLNNPEMRRMMFDPQFIRMQMNLQQQMGGGMGGMGGGAQNFPAPGVTDTTQPGQQNQGQAGQRGQQAQNPFGMLGGMGGPNASGANPFAALFGGNPGAVQGTTPAVTPPATSAGQTPAASTTPAAGATGGEQQPNPFANLLGGMGGGQQGANPMADMTRQMMQNPEMMRNMMQMMGMGGQGEPGQPGQEGGGQQQNPFGGFNPFAMGGMGGMGQQQPQQPTDSRPPEERYAEQLRQLNDMGFYEFERNVRALRMSGGSVQGAVEQLLSGI